jgi:hypothetical protein
LARSSPSLWLTSKASTRSASLLPDRTSNERGLPFRVGVRGRAASTRGRAGSSWAPAGRGSRVCAWGQSEHGNVMWVVESTRREKAAGLGWVSGERWREKARSGERRSRGMRRGEGDRSNLGRAESRCN